MNWSQEAKRKKRERRGNVARHRLQGSTRRKRGSRERETHFREPKAVAQKDGKAQTADQATRKKKNAGGVNQV